MTTEVKEEQDKKFGWKGFFVYAALLLIGVIALYPELYAMAGIIIEDMDIDMGQSLFTWLSMIQPFLIALGALLVGHFFAPKVNLRSLVYEKFDTGRSIKADLVNPLLIVIVTGVVVGSIMVSFDIIFRPYLPELLQLPVTRPVFTTFISRLAYGGIVEEVMLRFGFMTIAVYVLSMKGELLKNSTFIAGILFSAVVFALGHYGSTATYFEMTPLIWTRMLVLNGLGGIVYGWLYWKYHLEAAILAHMSTHVTMTLIALILYSLGV